MNYMDYNFGRKCRNGLWEKNYSVSERIDAIRKEFRCSYSLANICLTAADMISEDPSSQKEERDYLEGILRTAERGMNLPDGPLQLKTMSEKVRQRCF